MRLSIFITLSFLLCTLFCQCNGDIFVEEFAPAATEYTLNGDGDSITIQFASGDWDVSGGYFSSYQPYTWTICDVIGHPVKVDEQPHWEGLGKCLYDDFLLSVEITRDQYNKLYIKTCENAYKDSISLTLTISNSFTTQLITNFQIFHTKPLKKNTVTAVFIMSPMFLPDGEYMCSKTDTTRSGSKAYGLRKY